MFHALSQNQTRGGLHSELNTYVANDLINEIEITTEIENTNLGIVFSRTPCISLIEVFSDAFRRGAVSYHRTTSP